MSRAASPSPVTQQSKASPVDLIDIEHQYQLTVHQIREVIALRLSREQSEHMSLLMQRFEGAADLIAGTLLQELLQSADLSTNDDLFALKLEDAVYRYAINYY